MVGLSSLSCAICREESQFWVCGLGSHYDARFVERTVGRKRLEFTALAADVRAKLRIEAVQSFAHILQRLPEMFSRCQAHARYFDQPGLNSCTHDTALAQSRVTAREPVQQSDKGKRQRVTTPPDDRAGKCWQRTRQTAVRRARWRARWAGCAAWA